MKKNIKGTGLTKVETIEIDFAELAEIFRKEGEVLADGRIRLGYGHAADARRLVDSLTEHLINEGLPHRSPGVVVPADVILDEAAWEHSIERSELRVGERFLRLANYMEERFGYQSLEWYAAQMIRCTALAFGDGRRHDAVNSAVELGVLFEQYKWKAHHEKSAIFGLDQLDARRRGGIKANKARMVLMKQIDEEIDKRVSEGEKQYNICADIVARGLYKSKALDPAKSLSDSYRRRKKRQR